MTHLIHPHYRDYPTSLYASIGEELNLGSFKKCEIIQPLWSGYGQLVRIHFTQGTVIIKHVQLPKSQQHPRGWNSDRSHQRKLRSYQVETAWYQRTNTHIDQRCRSPKGLKCLQTDHSWLIVMEDLAKSGYPVTLTIANTKQIQLCLAWLAHFHARYIGEYDPTLWPTGTYWHLATRPDELDALQDHKLKAYAKRIDKSLAQVRFSTLVHGDAKLANFCFNQDDTKVAAVDFQYVGHGCAMKDLALFMSSAIAPEKWAEMESWLLDHYFAILADAIAYYQPHLDSREIELEWRPLFVVAWADFHRFIKGWSPNHWKINNYTEQIACRAIHFLDPDFSS